MSRQTKAQKQAEALRLAELAAERAASAPADQAEEITPYFHLPQPVWTEIKEWLGRDRGIADHSEWDGQSVTVVSYPDYQKRAFYAPQ